MGVVVLTSVLSVTSSKLGWERIQSEKKQAPIILNDYLLGNKTKSGVTLEEKANTVFCTYIVHYNQIMEI